TLFLNSVLNGFSLAEDPVSPGEIVELDLPGFDPGTTVDIGLNRIGPLGTSLAGAQVTFDGIAANLILAGPGRVVCIAPTSLKPGSFTQVQARWNGMLSNSYYTLVKSSSLGLLSANRTANLRNADGTLNSTDNPAALGS